jgi:trehalose 6-phosphate synthase
MDLTQESNPLIVIASNRGPFKFEEKPDGSLDVRRGTGGLVTALGALAEEHEVLWVASAMDAGGRRWSKQHNDEMAEIEGIYLKLIRPDQERYDQYYGVIANPLLWFIQHQLWDIPRTPSITPDTRQAWKNGYVAINKQFANAIADSVEETVGDTDRPVIVLPQDYHLYLVPQYLRERLGARVQIQPFIHIPWPGPDGWRILPEDMRLAILSSLLRSDRVGFQTRKDAFNFVQTCRFYVPDAHSHGARDAITYEGRRVGAIAYPISVDVERVQSVASQSETRLLTQQILNIIGDRSLILRVDRIEPSKNILRGLEAYRTLLDKYPEHRGRVQMLALLVPSRMEVDEYQHYLRDIMADSGMINAEFSDELWEPVRIVVGENYNRAIAAMQLYDVLLVNPIADGMNLVAKEGVLVNQRDGVLLLSESAGAFYELGDEALTVSPFDIAGMADSINEALEMPSDERHRREEVLRERVIKADVRRWFYAQVEDALRAIKSQESSDSTPGTPDGIVKSAESATASGVPSDRTPTP